MNLRFGTIQVQMTVYGGLMGALGGGILGAGFVALTYHPLVNMNIMLMFIGMTATTLVGGGFGLISGLVSGTAVAGITKLLFKRPRFRLVHKTLAGGITVMVTLVIFLYVAYAFGRPFIFDTQTYPSWIWALVVSVVGALIVSTSTVNAYIRQHRLKTKPAYARVRVD